MHINILLKASQPFYKQQGSTYPTRKTLEERYAIKTKV